MKYIVYLESVDGLIDDDSDKKPCDEAFRENHEIWETYGYAEDEWNSMTRKEYFWRTSGKNHTVTKNGNITRQFEDTIQWVVEINNLTELNDFADKYDGILVAMHGRGRPSIIIHDYNGEAEE